MFKVSRGNIYVTKCTILLFVILYMKLICIAQWLFCSNFETPRCFNENVLYVETLVMKSLYLSMLSVYECHITKLVWFCFCIYKQKTVLTFILRLDKILSVISSITTNLQTEGDALHFAFL